jgi:hypothetical protein
VPFAYEGFKKKGESKTNKLGMPRNEVMGTGSILLLTNCSTSDEKFPVTSPCVNHQKDLRVQYYIVKAVLSCNGVGTVAIIFITGPQTLDIDIIFQVSGVRK